MSRQALANIQAQQKSNDTTSTKGSLLQRAAVTPTITPVHSGILQRCSNGVECAECRQKRVEREGEGKLQRAAINSASTNTSIPPIVHEILSSSGQPLNTGTRAFMEPRFGHDFSQVRVHTDAKAAESARAVNALAYTVGRNVVFGEGQYAPETSEGRRLMAHELTHVVQQDQPFAAFSPSLTLLENEADENGDLIARGSRTFPSTLRTVPGIARQEASTGTVTIPEITVQGNPQFYTRAQRRNEYYAAHPPRPGWPYDTKLRILWLGRVYDDFADVIANYQVSVMGETWEQADGILGPQTASSILTQPIPDSAFVDVNALPPALSDPVRAIRENADFVERRVLGVNIFGWGGPFRLDLAVDISTRIPSRSFYMNRSAFDLFTDPFIGNAELALTDRIYASEAEARAAVASSPFRRPGFTVYAFYRGTENIIFPTIMSETTTPYLVNTLRAVVAQEQVEAEAASHLLIESFLLAVGLRYPMRLSTGTPTIGRLIIDAGRTLSPEELVIAGRLVQEGHVVRALAEGTTATSDFLVDGVATEVKTISNLTSRDISGALGRRILEGGRQGVHVIADTRQQVEVTFEVAERAARRAYGADRLRRIQQIRIIGQNFDITIPRTE